jgi:hypothetical protein
VPELPSRRWRALGGWENPGAEGSSNRARHLAVDFGTAELLLDISTLPSQSGSIFRSTYSRAGTPGTGSLGPNLSLSSRAPMVWEPSSPESSPSPKLALGRFAAGDHAASVDRLRGSSWGDAENGAASPPERLGGNGVGPSTRHPRRWPTSATHSAGITRSRSLDRSVSMLHA